VWDSKIGASAATLPNLMGERTFSPDGRYFVGVSRTGTQTTRLEVYRCRGTADAARPDPEARFRQERIDASAGRFVRPTSGEITQFLQGSHTGVDVAAPFGSLIAASDDGTVTATGWVAVGGNRVCVLHGGGLESCYYHTSLPLVSIGERVARGQPIALIGMTGLTTGPHTHWEAKLAGRIVDPLAR
jgi:murein DD-endopeptidase MepM/ murein hydrolase activator NlpD